MSTKIFSAYRFTGKLDELLPTLIAIRKLWMEQKIKELISFADYFKGEASKYKKEHWKGHADWDLCWMDYCDFLKKEKTNILRSDIINVNASAVLYIHKKVIYVQLFLNDWGFEKKIFLKSKRFSKLFADFHYQNQSDMPDDISRTEWKKREKVWDEIFADYSATPVDVGLVFEFATDTTLYEIAKAFEINDKKK